jgi:hypothetical protein
LPPASDIGNEFIRYIEIDVTNVGIYRVAQKNDNSLLHLKHNRVLAKM